MEYFANPGKQPEIRAAGGLYYRHAIKTHFIGVGDDLPGVLRRYALPLYRDGDLLLISEKVVSLWQKRVLYKKDIHISGLARFLSRFAAHSHAGVGVDEPLKMQAAIQFSGVPRILLATAAGAFGRVFHVRGLFYKVAGRETAGLDGFYSKAFEAYGELGIRVPDMPNETSASLAELLGMPIIIADANDYGVEILGKSPGIALSDDELRDILRDNPANNFREMTPFVLIRPQAGLRPDDVVGTQSDFCGDLPASEWYDYDTAVLKEGF